METPAYTEPKFTKWYNPLDVPQRVFLIMDGIRRKITWAPGETKELPSLYDSAINVVQNGVVVGGEARQMVNVSLPEDKRPKLHQVWDSQLLEQEELAANAAARALQLEAAERAAIIAAARVAKSTQVDKQPKK